MSSPKYVVLDSKPLEQWKVTELKEELRRRRLPIKGLKEDLLKRLDEAVRSEREAEEVETDGVEPDSKSPDIAEDLTDPPLNNGVKVDDGPSMVDLNTNMPETDPEVDQTSTPTENVVSTAADPEVDQTSTPTENVVSTVADPEVDQTSTPTENVVSTVAVEENVVPAVPHDAAGSVGQSLPNQPQLGMEEPDNAETEVKDICPEPSVQDDHLDKSIPNENQVSEVSSDLATDSVSINESNEIKDNLNTNNFNLEVELVKSDKMVQEPSSYDLPHAGSDLPSLNDQVKPGSDRDKVEHMVDDTNSNMDQVEHIVDDKNLTNMDPSKENDSTDGGSPEKLNLDRSPGDDLMEEDVLDIKQVDINQTSKGTVEKIESSEVHVVKSENAIDATVTSIYSGKNDASIEDNKQGITSEKRKLEDKEVGVTNEPVKRLRRWAKETIKVSGPPNSSQTPNTTADEFPKHVLNRSDSSLSADTPKERMVPPSPKPATTSLRIDRFLRPFTLKAVQELLARTGTVSSFWMDHIKTHCYVTYSSIEEAVETRNALYNLQWPPNGGRLLIAEFVDPQEVKARIEAPPNTPVAATAPPSAVPAQPSPSPRQNVMRQQLPLPPPLPPPPPMMNAPPARERVNLPAPPPKKPEPPIVTLDDLFRKTKATPRIYYLPLTEEQVAAKLAGQISQVNE